MRAKAPHNPKYYKARRCTRWDPYPSQQPLVVIAFDYEGYWMKSKDGHWYRHPSSFVFEKEISEKEAIESGLLSAEAIS